MKILELQQRTPEWYKARCGIPTASEFDKIITTEGKPSKQRQKYMYQLAGERLGAISDEGYISFAMSQGIEKEKEARSLYEMVKEPVVEVGFCLSDCGRYGASPDGLVGEDGVLEIKCPIVSTHVEYMQAEEIPSEYFQQTQGQILVTGRKWVDFVSYYPGLQPKIIREEPNEVFQKLLKGQLEQFSNELECLVKKLS